MPNLSQLKRQRMLAFLDKIIEEHKTDDEMLIAIGEIENALISKKYVWMSWRVKNEHRVHRVPLQTAGAPRTNL